MIKPTNSPFYIGIPARINEGLIEANISKDMASAFEFEEAEISLEIIVGESFFIPWKDSLIIEEKFSLDIKPIQEEQIQEVESKPTISVIASINEEDDKDDKNSLQESHHKQVSKERKKPKEYLQSLLKINENN